MAQDWAPFEKSLRDKLVTLFQARAEADGIMGITVKEVQNHLHTEAVKFESSGIYVVNPGYRKADHSSNVMHGVLRFPIVCNSKGLDDPNHQDVISDLVGVIVDALKANPTLDGLAGSAEIDEIHLPEVSAGSPVGMVVTQEVIVAIEIARLLQ